MIGRLVDLFGVVPRGELVALQETLRRVQRELAIVNARVEPPDSSGQAQRRIDSLEEKLRKRERQLEAAAREATELESRVTAALQDLDAARQHLQVTEVKLSILEAAANILDARMRATGPRVPDDHR